MTFDELLTLMRSTGLPFAAAGWSKEPEGDYGTVSYRAFDPLFADDRLVNITSEATVVLQSRTDGEENAAKIQQKLGESDLTWWLESVDYNPDTGKNVWIWAMLL